MKKIRFSIPLLIVILLIVGFGAVTYFNLENYKKMKATYIKINEKRIMDKLVSSIKIATDYEMLFEDIEKNDDYILDLNAFHLDSTPFMENSQLPEEHGDLFTKTVRNIDATEPFSTKNNDHIYMRIDPNNNNNIDDDIIVSAKIKDVNKSLFSEFYLLIINVGIGGGVTLILFILSFIFIGIGFAPLRRLGSVIPYVIHRGGKPFLIKSADSEVLNTISEFHRTTEELNEINRILTELAKTETKETFVLTMFRFLERKGMKSVVIINKHDGIFKTLAYKGVLENEDDIKHFSAKEEDLLNGQSELFVRILTTKSYVEINNENKEDFSEIDINIFGLQSIYMPVLVNDTVQAVIGGNGKINVELKKLLSIISSRWGSIIYGMVKNTVEKDMIKTKETISDEDEKQSSDYDDITETTSQDSEPINTDDDEYKSRKPIEENKDGINGRKVVEEINKENEEYLKAYKEGLVLAKKKNYEGAIQKLAPIAGDKEDLKLFKLIGTCYFNVREFKTAVKYWEKALKINPSDSTIKNYIEKAKQKFD